MDQQRNKPEEGGGNTDVTRTERQQVRRGASDTGEEQRQEGSKYKGNPEHEHGSHGEGQYQKQSDDATMRPSGLDEE